eukprot:scaffold221706_cov33-Tisochrysis_lutea.AAC.1
MKAQAKNGEDEDVVCMQQSREYKCPITMASLTETGDNRPVVPTNQGHTPRCMFSYAGIAQYCKGKRGAIKCPVCVTGTVNLKELKDDKTAARSIRLARIEQNDDADHPDAFPVE